MGWSWMPGRRTSAIQPPSSRSRVRRTSVMAPSARYCAAWAHVTILGKYTVALSLPVLSMVTVGALSVYRPNAGTAATTSMPSWLAIASTCSVVNGLLIVTVIRPSGSSTRPTTDAGAGTAGTAAGTAGDVPAGGGPNAPRDCASIATTETAATSQVTATA